MPAVIAAETDWLLTGARAMAGNPFETPIWQSLVRGGFSAVYRPAIPSFGNIVPGAFTPVLADSGAQFPDSDSTTRHVQ